MPTNRQAKRVLHQNIKLLVAEKVEVVKYPNKAINEERCGDTAPICLDLSG